jgi:DUF4097 and DUF4098 domain-containing protein YvlB
MQRILLGSFAALLAAGIAWGSGIMESEKKSFQGVDLVKASVSFVSLEARAGATGSVNVELVDIPSSVEVRLSQAGSKLNIEVKKPFWLVLMNFHGKILLTVPAGTEFDVESASGSVYFEGLRGPKVAVDSASGSVKLEGCEGVFDLNTASGSISLKRCDGGKVLKSASGSVKVDSSNGDIAVNTASGSISIENVDEEAAVKTETASGSIKFDDFLGRIKASSASGSISGQGVLLTGDSIFDSTSGSVKFDLKNDERELRFDLETVSGSLTAGSARGGKRLAVGSGKILVQGKTVSGSVRFE